MTVKFIFINFETFYNECYCKILKYKDASGKKNMQKSRLQILYAMGIFCDCSGTLNILAVI